MNRPKDENAFDLMVAPDYRGTFDTAQNARNFRQEHGTGGWIFSPDDGSPVILFQPWIYPSAIFHHPLTLGKSGTLIGCC